ALDAGEETAAIVEHRGAGVAGNALEATKPTVLVDEEVDDVGAGINLDDVSGVRVLVGAGAAGAACEVDGSEERRIAARAGGVGIGVGDAAALLGEAIADAVVGPPKWSRPRAGCSGEEVLVVLVGVAAIG